MNTSRDIHPAIIVSTVLESEDSYCSSLTRKKKADVLVAIRKWEKAQDAGEATREVRNLSYVNLSNLPDSSIARRKIVKSITSLEEADEIIQGIKNNGEPGDASQSLINDIYREALNKISYSTFTPEQKADMLIFTRALDSTQQRGQASASSLRKRIISSISSSEEETSIEEALKKRIGNKMKDASEDKAFLLSCQRMFISEIKKNSAYIGKEQGGDRSR